MAIPQNNVRAVIKAQGGRVDLPFTKEYGELSCPFGIYLGYATNTPNGEKEGWGLNVNDYALFQEVLTGSDSVSLLWEQANEIKNKKIVKSVGIVNKVYITNYISSFSQAPLPASSDLISTEAISSFEAYAEGQVYSKTDIFRFHTFPRKFDRTLFILETIDEHKGPNGDILYQKLTFKSLQNEISKSGLAIEQFPHFGAPGMEYSMPIYDETKGEIIVDPKDKDLGVDSFQIEFYGNVCPISIAFGGRSLKADVDKNDLIVPCVMMNPKPSSFSNSSAPNTNFYIAQDMKIQLQERFKQYKEAISANSNAPFEKREFQGMFKTSVAGCTLSTSAPVQYVKTLLDNELIDTKYSISNIPSSNNYFHVSDAFAAAKLTEFSKQSPISMLWRNHLCLQHLNEIPVSEKTSIKFNVNQIPILGGLINSLTFGLLPDTNITTYQKKVPGISALVEAQSLDHASKLFGDSSSTADKYIPLDFFRNEDTGEMAQALSTKSYNTCLRFSLTKNFADKSLNEYKATQAESYTFLDVFDNVKNKQFKDNTTSVHIDGKLEKYIISQMYMKVIGAATYRITFFNGNDQVWTGVYQTKAKRSATGSVHQIQHTSMLDPVNTIKGASKLMDYVAINIDKGNVLDRLVNQIGINKTIHLDNKFEEIHAPDPSLPIHPDLKEIFEIPISSLYDLGATQNQSDLIVVKGYYEKFGRTHEVVPFTLRVPNKVGSVDGEGKEVDRRGRLTRWGVVAEVIAGGKLRLTTYDTGERSYVVDLSKSRWIVSQKMKAIWETANVITEGI